jgi:hypothetical protein
VGRNILRQVIEEHRQSLRHTKMMDNLYFSMLKI